MASRVGLAAARFFTYIWNSRFVRYQIESTARTTAGIHKISQRDIEGFVIPLPDLETQHAVVQQLDRVITSASESDALAHHALVRGARLRQSILKRAFEGKLVPQDPNDEPASALLERIRAERALHAKTPASRKDGGHLRRGKRASTDRTLTPLS